MQPNYDVSLILGYLSGFKISDSPCVRPDNRPLRGVLSISRITYLLTGTPWLMTMVILHTNPLACRCLALLICHDHLTPATPLRLLALPSRTDVHATKTPSQLIRSLSNGLRGISCTSKITKSVKPLFMLLCILLFIPQYLSIFFPEHVVSTD